MFAGGATDEVGPVRRAFGWESKRYGRRHDLLFRCRWTANSRVKSFWRLRVRRRGRRVAARAVFTVRSAAWYCLRARCAGGTGGNCLIFTVLAAAVPGAVRCCLRAHRHAGCAAATVACTVGSAGPACLGFCVTFLSLLSSSSPSVLPGLVVGVLGAHRHAGCAAATVACRVDLRAQDGIFVFGNRSKPG